MTGSSFYFARQLSTQRGYILLPVVLLITLVAAVAWMLNNASLLDGGITASVAESAQAEYVAQAGLHHALQQTRQSGCGPFTDLTGAPLGNHSYTTTLTSGLGSTTSYTLVVDQDTWIRSDNPTDNRATDSVLSIGYASGKIDRALYRYDLSSIPASAPILSATAWFYVTREHPGGPVDIHRLTADWAETDATWSTHGDKMDSAMLATIPTQPVMDVWVQVNLTAQVQAWVNGEPNYGITLNSTSEGMDAGYASREYGSQPYLEVVVAVPADATTLAATGTLDSGINRTITRDNVALYQQPSHYEVQPDGAGGKDALIYQWKADWNYGSANSLIVRDWGSDSDYHSLLQFNLGSIPHGAAIHSAQLALYQNTNSTAGGSVDVYRITSDWVEGSGNGSTAAGVTWNERDTGLAWTTPGGDFGGEADASTTIPVGTQDWINWDITGLVAGWVNDDYPNHGLALVHGSSNAHAIFESSDATDPTLRPRLIIRYACGCGSPCMALRGSGNVLLVVVNPTTLVPADAEKKALFESWGYTVNVISESANQGTFDAGATANDVVYVSSTVNSNTLGGKLANLPIGIVSEDGDYNPDLGFAADAAWTVGSAVNVTDTSHYITAPFAAGPLEIYSGGMEQLTVSGSEAPGLQTLADTGGAGSLVVLDSGAMGSGGSAVAGPRVMLPLGRWASFNWDYLNANGRLLVQRALQWGTGNFGAPPKNLLLVVVDPSSLTAQETAKKALIESWGYTVNLIDESDSQANFDAAIAANDAAYIPQDINSTNLGTKLRNATIGVVNEEGEQVDELGIAGDKIFKSRHEIDIVDNSHYITQPFATGLLTFVSSDQSVHMLSGDIAPGLLTLAQSFNVGSQWEPSLAVIETGDDLDISGTAAGRRVQLPWGGGTFDINQLNADGQTIMQRAIDWAAGAGAAAAPQTILFVVPDAAALGSQDTAKKTLMESWGFNVSLITAAEPQSVFDAAVAGADVAYISEEAVSSDTGTKLRDATIGVVNEETALTDEFGVAGSRTGYTGTDIEVVNTTHYITSVFAGGPLTIASSATELNRLTASLAPGLDALAETTGDPELGAIETGGLLYDGGTAAGRRVQLPWGPDGFDINLLNGDGQTLMRRAIEWGAGATISNGQTILFAVDDATSLSPQELVKQALMESWGYTVTLISDTATQTEFDTAMASSDVAYVSQDVRQNDLGTKLVGATIGVVNEETELYDEFGVAERSWTANSQTAINLIDNTHYISSPFTTGNLTFLTASQTIAVIDGSFTIAPDLQALAETASGTTNVALSALDTGATTWDGGTAAGRRVQLPWGPDSFDINGLNADGQTIMRRALEWAAGAGAGGGGGGGGGPTGVVFEGFSAAGGNGNNLPIAKPAGTAEGDLLIMALATDGNTVGSLSAPAGWNIIDLTSQSGAVTFGVWWKLAGASEPGTYTITWSGNAHHYGWLMRFTGHDPATPIDVSTNTGGTSGNPTSPAVTTTVDDALILRLGGFDDDDINNGNPGLSGHTAINMGDSGNGPSTASGGSGYVQQPAAGSSGTSNFTLTGNEEYRAVTIGIAPAP